ncbi:capsule assembly Wzi family protein [Roseivirga sp.]|uniref:capsule assembly Wzi family protein n=1 Tax=Roseivirga sp. TaxID=1964215 RepID=UPI003B8AB74C
MVRGTLWITFILLMNGNLLKAQINDSLNVSVSVGSILSSNAGFLPHYLVNNRWGEVSENQRFFVSGKLSYQSPLSKTIDFSTEFSFRNDVLSTHYFSLSGYELELIIGRYKRTVGGLENDLSIGSLGMSQNALPIPQIGLSINEFIDVPFTAGFFKIKGHLSHGWFEDERHVANAQLHSKSFYLKLDLSKEIGWSASSGVIHFAQFGGNSPVHGIQPSSFSDYLRVFAGSGIPNPDGTTEGESNGLGNHLGIIETTVTQEIGGHKLTINYQKPFEDQGGLQYVSLTDYLFGLEWELSRESSVLNKVYIEYMQTKWQGGPGVPDPIGDVVSQDDNFGYSFGGRDDMYNNWLYRDGWTYKNRVIGNPLFLTFNRARNFFGEFPDYARSIVNNRIRAVNIGLKGRFSNVLSYHGLFTYTNNFGTYTALYEGRFNWNGPITNDDFEYVFRPGRDQVYTQLKFRYDQTFRKMPIFLELRIAYDFGDLYNAFGSEFSVTYNFTKD